MPGFQTVNTALRKTNIQITDVYSNTSVMSAGIHRHRPPCAADTWTWKPRKTCIFMYQVTEGMRGTIGWRILTVEREGEGEIRIEREDEEEESGRM